MLSQTLRLRPALAHVVALALVCAVAPQSRADGPLTSASSIEASFTGVRRHDLVVKRDGLGHALAEAGISDALEQLDEAFVLRLDLYSHLSHLSEGTRLAVFLDGRRELVAASVRTNSSSLFAARYQGALAPHGFYDERGLSLSGPLRARPVVLSRVTSRFGQRFDPIKGSSRTAFGKPRQKMHHGTDYGVPIGTEVLAAGTGRVKARGSSPSAGNFIKLAHEDGYESWYLHLDRFEPGSSVGERVAQNQVIARSGNTGRSTGPHVHYELHLAGQALDSQRTMPIPNVALGPIALRQHKALIQQLQLLAAHQPAHVPAPTREATR